MSVDRFYVRKPGHVRATNERLAAIRRAAMKAAALPPRKPIAPPVIRSRKAPR